MQALHAAEDLAPRVAATGLPSGASASNATSSGCRSSRTTRQHRWRPRSRRHSHSSRRPTTTWRYTSPSEPVPSSRSVPHTSTRPLTPATAPWYHAARAGLAQRPRLALSLLLPRLDDGHSHSRVAGSTGSGRRPGSLDLACIARAPSMMGQAEQGRSMMGGDPPGARDRGGGIKLAVTTAIESAEFESLAGDVEAAARLSEDGCRQLEALGDVGFLSTALATRMAALRAWRPGRGERVRAAPRRARRGRRRLHAVWMEASRSPGAGTPRRQSAGSSAGPRGGLDRRRHRVPGTGRRTHGRTWHWFST